MHQTFTGSSRRPRQVNLSGRRNTNPFAAAKTATEAGTGPILQSTIVRAQAERARRHHEQNREKAIRTIQRNWRGYHSRKTQKHKWRHQWDLLEVSVVDDPTKEQYSHDHALSQFQWLFRFVSPASPQDIQRLRHWLARSTLLRTKSSRLSSMPWSSASLGLQLLILQIMDNITCKKIIMPDDLQFLFDGLKFAIQQNPEMTMDSAKSFYATLASFVRYLHSCGSKSSSQLQAVTQSVVAPLRTASANLTILYEAFACEFLILPELSVSPFAPIYLEYLADNVSYQSLTIAMTKSLSSTSSQKHQVWHDQNSRAYILAYIIYIYRRFQQSRPRANSSDNSYLFVISALLSSLDPATTLRKPIKDDTRDGQGFTTDTLKPFIMKQILSLVEDDNISRLLVAAAGQAWPPVKNGSLNDDIKHIASFALTLLRVLPESADDVRIQLYKSAISRSPISSDSVPAIRFFWEAAKYTLIFETIKHDIDSVVPFLRGQHDVTAYRRVLNSHNKPGDIQDQWRVILIFFELYAFAMRLMDDEEFFSAENPMPETPSNWASQNALPLEDVKVLILFLKNLVFSMIFNALDLQHSEERKSRDIASISHHFRTSSHKSSSAEAKTSPESTIVTIAGESIDHVKDIAVGLLRMLYERDSRRPFLPQGHWLMTEKLDMGSFISAVVDEDAKRRQFQEDEEYENIEMEDIPSNRDTIIGASRSSRLRQQEKSRQQQQRRANSRFLAAVAPRLEILQSMPFFIPFETRVQIFRKFISLDQQKRRGRHSDPDIWRHGLSQERLWRHHARIRREHIFEDALNQFYSLGDGLKEPIQITFVDSFDNEEAGIDGGGVTKEFLDSITKKAFEINNDQHMWVENDHHLLYPNPDVVDEVKEFYGHVYGQNSIEAREAVKKLLESYEFLGRIIGKCLYEGILVDVNFAGFFLLKWATANSSKLSGRGANYRENLNDLRDFDEALYQGLLKLKNYPDDVSHFGQDFTIVDTITTDRSRVTTKNVERPLRHNGSNIPVTNENRLVYISCVARYRLQERPYKQTAAFLLGLSTLINPDWLSMFNQTDLQTLVGGTSSSINISDLRQNTQYGGVYVIGDDGLEHPTVMMFWDIMQEMRDEDCRAVLKFVTSTPNAPLLGFGSLMPRFSIRDSGSDQTRLPSTSTCVNLLKLPIYRSKELLRNKLLQAVNSGAGFDLS